MPSRGRTTTARPPVALYVHIPFCLSICPYCDFVVYAGREARGPAGRVGSFLEALHAELDLRADAWQAHGGALAPLRSVYVGGGTPSLLAAPAMGALLEHAARRFGLARDAEVTIEVNPGPADRGDMAGFRAAGATRISIGAQSLDDSELRRLGRRHRAMDVVDTMHVARSAGFDDVSLDLLYDIPGQALASWSSTLAAALGLQPDHLSAYALTLDDPDSEGSTGPSGDHRPLRPGTREWRVRARHAQDDDRAAEMYEMAAEDLERAGLVGYELSNWAVPGHESRHNLAYWQRRPFEGLGPGAHAFDGDLHRRWNAASLDRYIAALMPGGATAPALPPGGEEHLDAATGVAEEAILGLRVAAGLPTSQVSDPTLGQGIAWGLVHGLLESRGPTVRLTRRGRLLANELFSRLLPEADGKAVTVPAA